MSNTPTRASRTTSDVWIAMQQAVPEGAAARTSASDELGELERETGDRYDGPGDQAQDYKSRERGCGVVDVDEFYNALTLRLRPYTDDARLTADALMATLLTAFEQIWNDGHDSGVLAWAPDPPPGNPYGLEHFPDWPRRAQLDR